MRKRSFWLVLTAVVLISCLHVAVAAADDAAMIGTTGYGTLQEAVDAWQDTDAPVRLQADIEEAVTVSKDTYLDLNGFDVTGVVSVTGGTLYCMDSQTDDYTVEDNAGYGKLYNASGKVAGVPEEAPSPDGWEPWSEHPDPSYDPCCRRAYDETVRCAAHRFHGFGVSRVNLQG